MGSIWCVKPDVDKLELTWIDPEGTPHNLWIKVKRRLTVGEERKVMTAGWRSISNLATRGPGGDQQPGDAAINIDWKAQSFARASVYLVEWSLEDDANKRLPLNTDTLESLHPTLFTAIENALTAHIEACNQEKKVTDGEIKQPQT